MTTSNSLEDLAFHAIRSGRVFARLWHGAGIEAHRVTRPSWTATFNQLDEGQLIKGVDLDGVAAMGDALRRALNIERPGYGDRAMQEDTRYDDLAWEPRLNELRRVSEAYKHFRDCQERYADRLTAEREAARAF